MKQKRYCIDIDNTICTTIGKKYQSSKPKKKIINLINNLYNNGNIIIIFTSRYMGRNNDNVKKTTLMGYQSTYKQLKSWGLQFHKLIMGKPSFDIYIDDKSINFNKNWYKKIRKNN